MSIISSVLALVESNRIILCCLSFKINVQKRVFLCYLHVRRSVVGYFSYIVCFTIDVGLAIY